MATPGRGGPHTCSSVRRRNLSHPLARDYNAVNNDRHGKQNKTNFITGTGTFCTRNSLSFYPHTRTVTPRYLPPSITDSVTSHGGAPLRGPRCAAVRDGHPRRDAVAQAGFPAVGQRGAAGAARARLAGRQRARGACWRAFCCGMWGCARALTGVVCCCCALLRRAGFRNVADEQQRRQWGRDLPIILPVGARRVHRLNHFQQHGAMTGVGSGALAL